MKKKDHKDKGGGPKGNKYGIKLKDPELRQLAFKDYCAHRAAGRAHESWTFEHNGFTCHWQTMEKYMADEEEFNPNTKTGSIAKGYLK